MADVRTTHFAPAQRAHPRTLAADVTALGDVELLRELGEAVSEILLVLNPQRQIVYANRQALALLGVSDPRAIHGLRPGEALGCPHAAEDGHGCGTTVFCQVCGAVRAILASQAGQADVQECRVTRGPDAQALDLRVRTTPLTLGGQTFTLCAISDISDAKRRRALERVFFHDVLNTAGAVRMLGEMLEAAVGQRRQDLMRQFQAALDRLMEELLAQRELAAAENAELTVEPRPLMTRRFLEGLIDLFGHCPPARDRRLELAPTTPEAPFRGDPRLLSRVLGNLIKNALEACPPGLTVTVGGQLHDGGVAFGVHNPGAMDPQVQLQIFQRSFSTKGPGRGLGTYSVKLLTEQYLGGRVCFTSDASDGTMFRVWVPLEPPVDE